MRRSVLTSSHRVVRPGFSGLPTVGPLTARASESPALQGSAPPGASRRIQKIFQFRPEEDCDKLISLLRSFEEKKAELVAPSVSTLQDVAITLRTQCSRSVRTFIFRLNLICFYSRLCTLNSLKWRGSRPMLLTMLLN